MRQAHAGPINRNHFFSAVRSAPFDGSLTQSQVDGLTHLLDIWEECYVGKHPDQRLLAYALATTFHETGAKMQPVREIGEGGARAYGHPAGPWHQVYYGRGDVQETWYANYARARQRLKAELGIDIALDEQPDLALEPDYAAHILFLGMIEGWFTGRKLGDYFGRHIDDPLHARRIINGMDHAAKIAGHHHDFEKAIPLEAAKAAA
jgi:hypothetical protein